MASRQQRLDAGDFQRLVHLEIALVLVRLDRFVSAHLRLGASDFYLYANLTGVRLCDLCSRPHLLKAKGSKRGHMTTTNAIADLRQQIHDDLRIQHPEWILPNGRSPMCDAYEARLMDLLAFVPRSQTPAQIVIIP